MNIITLDPVEKFQSALDGDTSAKIDRAVRRLKTYGRTLVMPYAKHIEGRLFELRISGRKNIRIFYCFRGENIYLLHVFEKKRDKIPVFELETARARLLRVNNI